MSYPFIKVSKRHGMYAPDPNGEVYPEDHKLAGEVKSRTVGMMCRTKTWGEWCEKLKHISGKKKGFEAIIWGDFTANDEAKPKQYKGDARFSFQSGDNFKQRNVVAIDVDGSDVDVDEIITRLDESGVNYLLYTSFSYDPLTEGKLKFRIFLPIDRMIQKKEYEPIVLGAIEKYGLVGVDVGASKTTNMLMYLPECPTETLDDALIEYVADKVDSSADDLKSVGEFFQSENDSSNKKNLELPENIVVNNRHDFFKTIIGKLYHGGFKEWNFIQPMLNGLNEEMPTPLDSTEFEGLSRVFLSIERGEAENDECNIDAILEKVASGTLEDISELQEVFLKQRAIEIMVDKYVYIRQQNKYWNTKHCELIARETVTNDNRGLFCFRTIGMDTIRLLDGGSTPVTFLEESVNLRKVSNLTWYPVAYGAEIPLLIENSAKKMCVNSYQHIPMKPVQNDKMVERYMTLLELIIICPKQRKTVLQFMAHAVLHPEEKTNWNLVLYSLDKGTGKDTLMSVMSRILGNEMSVDLDPRMLKRDFNEELGGKILVNFHEMQDEKSKKDTGMALKIMAADTASGEFSINPKGAKPYSAKNVMRLVLHMNTLKGLDLEHGDRRYFIPELSDKKFIHGGLVEKFGGGIEAKDDDNFFKLWKKEWLGGGLPEAVLYHLVNDVDISDFVSGDLPFQTTTHEEAQVTSMTNWQMLVTEQGFENHLWQGCKLFESNQIINWLTYNDENTFHVVSKSMTNFLKEQRYVKLKQIKKDGKKVHLWTHNTFEEEMSELGNEELLKIFNE